MQLRRDWDGPWKWLATFGLVCVAVGISGQAIKAMDVEIGALTSVGSRIGLILLGLIVSLVALVQPKEAALPSPRSKASETELRRVRELQELLGLHTTDVDGKWGPKTRTRCLQQIVGSSQHVAPRAASRLAGNRNKELVVWVQRQLNRKYSAGLIVDGIPGGATHRVVVELLGETDGIVGPRGYRVLTLD